MATNIESLPVGVYMQSGNGVPTHISPKGTEYTDLDTAIVYINKDGVATWAEFLDSTFVITGGTSSYFTGGTVTGPTNFLNGVTANTISATTYYGLPTDVRVTGGTYSSGTILFTNNTGGTFTVTGLTTGSSTTVIQFTGGTVTGATIFTGGVSANTISATTYQNLPNDLPPSGTTGQILAKNSNTNYDVIWIDNYTSELKHIVKAGEAISKGQAVYVSSANGTNMIVSKASNTSEATSSKTLGLLAQDLALNGQGFVITEGLLAGLDTGTANAGDAVWLGTNGNLIFGLLNKPVAPAHLVYIGVVTRAQTNNGEIFVKPQNGFEFNELHDVLLTGVTNGDLVSYNSATSLWKNSKTLDGNYNVTGTLSATTISATTYQNLPLDIRVTGGTYSSGTAIFTNNTGGTFTVTGLTTPFTGGTVIALTATTISATTYQNLPTDIRVTGGTYSNGVAVFANNTGGTFSVNGFSTGYTLTSSGITTALGYVPLSAYTDTKVTGGTYSNGTTTFTNNTGGTFSVTGLTTPFTGGTVSGGTFFTDGLTANTLTTTSLITAYGGLSGSSITTPLIQNSSNFKIYLDTYSSIIGVYNGGYDWNFLPSGAFRVPNTIFGGTYDGNQIALGATAKVSALRNNIIEIETGTGGTADNTFTFLNDIFYSPKISATTYLNLPTDVRVTGGTYSNNTFTFTNNTGGTFNTLFNTVTGLTVNGNLTVTGVTFNGGGTFTKAGYGAGDLILDNNGTDSPGLLLYYGNNNNWGVDTWNGSYSVLSGQLLRFTNNLNESGGAVKVAVDVYGNMVVNGFVSPGAWRAGQIIKDTILSNTEVTVNATTIATSSSDTDFISYSYTPVSSSSYLIIHYHLASYDASSGTGNDSWISRVKVDGNEITYSKQSTVNGNRSGVLFPLTGRYTNGNTTAKTIVIACRRDSGDDSIVITNSASSMWLRITEIAR